MDRLEEINKQITKLEAERKALIENTRNIESKLEEYYQEALKLKSKYIMWSDNAGTTRLAKVFDVSKEDQIGLELTKFFASFSDSTFCSDNYEFETYASYVSHTGLVNFDGKRFQVISESEYIKFIRDAVDKFCQGDPDSWSKPVDLISEWG